MVITMCRGENALLGIGSKHSKSVLTKQLSIEYSEEGIL